jgi:PDZ domain-containing protein
VVSWAPPTALDGAPGDGAPPEAERRRRRWVTPTILTTIAVVGVIAIVCSVVTLPYYALAPGSAKRVDSLLRVSDTSKLYPHKGDVLFTTVSLYKARPLDAVQSWFDHNIELVPEKRILGDAKPDELNHINLEEMADSKDTAVAVALRRIGATESGSGAQIASVGDNVAATGHLKVGDVVVDIDGKPTPLAQDAIDAIRAHKPGDATTLTVRGTGTSGVRTEKVILGKSPQNPSMAYLGVGLTTKDSKFNVPYDVTIDSGSVGGPSAGLAFTLEIIDSLTPGELTGGNKIAVTGTIQPDGTVGPIGGIVQKTAAVRAAGAKAFLVPPDEYADAKAHAGSKLRIIKVATLEQAIDALRSLGGDTSSLPPPPATLQK